MARPVSPITLSEEARTTLQRLVAAKTTEQRIVRRARIILLRSTGASQEQVAAMVGVRRTVVSQWEKRFAQEQIAGLAERQRSGRKPTIKYAVRAEILTKATQPPPGRTRWSTRTLAKELKISASTVARVWRANDPKPHLKGGFKLSNDKQFEAKFWDVIGLYLNPPEKALVLCCDEKSQCQALERSQPGLPLGIGHIRTATHDYTRHGVITLFAALNYLDGKLIHDTAERHTHVEWLAFLKKIHRETPEDLTLHIILDNYATHKHAKVQSWVKWLNQRHRNSNGVGDVPRMVFHFTPTSSSWMNMVERFFRDLTVDCVRDGSFRSIAQLVEAIELYLAKHNRHPRRYVWKKEGAKILEKIARARAALEKNS